MFVFQVAFGDDGLSYTFSGHTVPAKPWLPFLIQIRDEITRVTGYSFNFVLINRYAGKSCTRELFLIFIVGPINHPLHEYSC